MGRPLARRASRPSDAAWNMPRQRSSERSPASPGANEGGAADPGCDIGTGVTRMSRVSSTPQSDGGKGPPRTLWYLRPHMQTALQRRQRHRRQGAARRGRGGGSARRAALAIPLLLFSSFLILGGVGFIGTVTAYAYYSKDLPDPAQLLHDISFEQPSIVYGRSE